MNRVTQSFARSPIRNTDHPDWLKLGIMLAIILFWFGVLVWPR